MKNPSWFAFPFDISRRAGGSLISIALWIVLSHSSTVSGAVRINELYYDHPGPDAGHEFIELFNSDTLPVSLSGYALEFHNGSGGGWERLWTAGTGDSIPAGRPFVVGGEAVEPLPEVIVGWSLQNGPDAVRLVHLDTVADLVGYGDLEDPAFVEGTSAPAVKPGQSLARMPDGVDTDDNKRDFQPAEPSPGALNRPENDVSIRLDDGTPWAAAVEPYASEWIWFRLINEGTRELAAGAAEVELSDSTAAVGCPSQVVSAPNLPAGAEASVALAVQLTEGVHVLTGRIFYSADERLRNNTCRLIRRAGSPPLLVSEVMVDPPDTCPQYIEIYNAGIRAVAIQDYHLRDDSGEYVSVTADSVMIDPESYLVVTPDSGGLVKYFPYLRPDQLVEIEGSWPYFNRSGSGGFADSVILADACRIPVNSVDYPPQPASQRGRSLERIDLFIGSRHPVWVMSRAAGGGSPGRPAGAALLEPPPASMTLSPNPFSPTAGENLFIAVDPAEAVARVSVSVFDLLGRRIRILGSTASFPYVFVWNGDTDSGGEVTAGLYIVAGEYFSTDGRRADVKKVVVGCGSRKD